MLKRKVLKIMRFKINAVFKCLLLAVCLSLLSSCKLTFFSPKDTIRAPGATGYFEGVRQALETAVGGETVLRYPMKGEERSAFSVHDFDSDGTDEIVAFYRMRSEMDAVRLNMLKYEDGKWVSVQDIGPIGNDLEKIGYADLDLDGVDELVVGCSVTAAISNKLTVYGYQKGKLVQRASEDYNDFVICDIDSDGAKELGLLKTDKNAKTSQMNFYRFSPTTASAVGSVALDGNVLSYAPAVVGKLKNGAEAVYLDAYKDANTLITELIYFDGEKITDPFINSETLENTATLRYGEHLCTDMDADGVLDIPFSAPIIGYDVAPSATRQYLIKWQCFDGKACIDTKTLWYSNVLGFYFEFGDDWSQSVTVALDSENTYAVFSLWNTNLNLKGDDIFRVRRFGVVEWQKNPLNYYSVIYSNSDYVWAVSLSEIGNSKFKLDLGTIKNRFGVITS